MIFCDANIHVGCAHVIVRPYMNVAEPHLLAEAWGHGYLAGLADMQNGQERPNPYRSKA